MTAITSFGSFNLSGLTTIGSGQSQWSVVNSDPSTTTGGTGTDAGALTQTAANVMEIPLNGTSLELRYEYTGSVSGSGPTVNVWGFDRLNDNGSIPTTAKAELLSTSLVLGNTSVGTSPDDTIFCANSSTIDLKGAAGVLVVVTTGAGGTPTTEQIVGRVIN